MSIVRVIIILLMVSLSLNGKAQSPYKIAYQKAQEEKKIAKRAEKARAKEEARAKAKDEARAKDEALSKKIANKAISFDFTGTNRQSLTYRIIASSAVEVIQNENYKQYEKVVIPEYVFNDGYIYTVTSIGEYAFWYCETIKEVIIPNSIKKIDRYAFYNCTSLERIDGLQASTTIGENAFKDCLYTYEQYLDGGKELNVSNNINNLQASVSNTNISIPQNNSNQTPAVGAERHSSDVDINIPSTSNNNENTFAIIFANENYQEEADVDFALNDGEVFKQYCQQVLGLPNDNIHIRKNATLNNIHRELDWIKKVAQAYDGCARIIVYYAGHGIPDEKTGTGYLLPVDGSGSSLATGYSLANFYKVLGDLPAKDIIVFMDACFSGSKRGEGMLASARGVAIKAKPCTPKGNMVVLTAAQADETAYPLKDQGHGMFTYYLLKKLKEDKGDVSLLDLSNYVTTQVKRKSIVANGKSQTPTISVSPALGDKWKDIKLK